MLCGKITHRSTLHHKSAIKVTWYSTNSSMPSNNGTTWTKFMMISLLSFFYSFTYTIFFSFLISIVARWKRFVCSDAIASVWVNYAYCSSFEKLFQNTWRVIKMMVSMRCELLWMRFFFFFFLSFFLSCWLVILISEWTLNDEYFHRKYWTHTVRVLLSISLSETKTLECINKPKIDIMPKIWIRMNIRA